MIRILHVEDMPEDAELLQIKLRKFNSDLELSWSSSAQDALANIENQSFDCILSDYQMPGMNGLDLLKQLRNRGTNLPFIFFTGQGNEHLAEEAFNNGADDYYTKEAGFAHYDRLVNSIRRVVEGHRASEHRIRSERALRAILNGTATETSTSFFRSLVLNLARAAGVRYATIGRKLDEEIRTLAFAADGEIADNFKYHYRYAPCNETLKRGLFYVPDSVQEQFPAEKSLVEMGLESYCGCRLTSSTGEFLGVLTLLHDEPLEDKQFILSIMRIFGSRASAEVEREIAIETLRNSERRYRNVFNGLEDAIVIFEPETLKIVEVNSAFLKLTKFDYGEAMDLNSATIGMLSLEESEIFVRDALSKLDSTGRVYFKWKLATKSAGFIDTEVSFKDISMNDKKLVLAIIKT